MVNYRPPTAQLAYDRLVNLKDPLATKHDVLYLVDLGKVVCQLERWRAQLPRVEPHYAVKCNPDVGILKTLAENGANFDCASKAELEAVLGLGLPIDPSRIIYANPSKMRSQLKFVASAGVELMTFDNEDELYKIADLAPNARLILRIFTTDDSQALMPLGTKFGARVEDTPDLFAKALELNLNVVGVSYHVGSGCYSTSAFTDAIRMARRVFDIAKDDFGLDLSILDIGGGWPGCKDDGLIFEDIAAAVRPVLDELFPANVRIISEPGRYFACESHTMLIKIESSHGPITDDNGKQSFTYVLPEGVYGPFKDALLFDVKFVPQVFSKNSSDETLHPATLRGPTDNALDVIAKDVMLPKLESGDWLMFPNMGAYTRSLSSSNTAFGEPQIIHFLKN